MKDLITKGMIEHFNLKMKDEGTCLRIVEDGNDGEIKHYKLAIVDKYIDSDGFRPNITKECETMVRDFFCDYGIKLPFTNSVLNIWAFTSKEE